MALTTERPGPHSVIIRDDGEAVCEIRDLTLRNARFQRAGRFLVGAEVPLPLYWEQYAGHEHPERNAGSYATVRVLDQNGDMVRLECLGTTASGEALSRYLLTIERIQNPPRYSYDIQALLTVAERKTWLVTPNDHHGELEFCNFWADGVFSADRAKPNRYRGCYILHGDLVTMIPHHHLESPDKHNILLDPGDRMAWLLEDENPVIDILTGDPVTAGVCAYMWDAHLAVKVCHDGEALRIQGGTSFRAHLRISSINRADGRPLADRARVAVAPETYQTPVIVDGVHRFAETLATAPGNPADVWPWEHEEEGDRQGGTRLFVDRGTGYDDESSLCIESSLPARAAWKATALGSAFRQPPFRNGASLLVRALVRTHLAEGSAGIVLRLHREGDPGLFDPSGYEVYRSPASVSGVTEWTRIEVSTPPLSPPPDRLQVLLELTGTGRCWFDNVQILSKP